MTHTTKQLPAWFKQEIPDMATLRALKKSFAQSKLSTVCQSARCPNLGQCWGKGVATFMILGDRCTRACRFCAVEHNSPRDVDSLEPKNVALEIKRLGLKYVVITSVTRDDLPDKGAHHFAQTIREIKELSPSTHIEVLIPDFLGDVESFKIVMKAEPNVISHNMETVERLSKSIRPQADYHRSLNVLSIFGELSGAVIKSGFMVGLGENIQEAKQLMSDIRNTGCQMLTIGQYLRPIDLTRHVPVERFYTLEEFQDLKDFGMNIGFQHVMSAPLVRSSYLAEEGYASIPKAVSN